MEPLEPIDQPPVPDRDGVPRTLLVFAWATLVALAAVVLIAVTDAVWVEAFALGVILLLFVIVVSVFKLDLGRQSRSADDA